MLITDEKALANYTASKCLWLGIPSIEVTKKGRTFLTFYSGGTKEEIGNYVLLVKSEDGITFSNPIAVCFEEGYRCFDPCLWIDPLGRLWLTWSRCPQDGLFGAICDNPDADEIVFGKEFFIGNNVMMNKPIVLSTGEWMFPVAVWNNGIRALPSNYDSNVVPKGSFAYITCDKGKTFKKLGYADVKKRSFDEHMFLEMDDRVLRVFVRTAYGIGAADSYDGGNHWGNDFDTGYGGPCSRFHIRRLPSGRILLINHYRFNGRNNLTALLSEDNGKTFAYRLLLDERNSVSYPDAAIDSEGMIHITYDRERGAFCSRFDDIMNSAREILTACICEEDIIKGSLVNEKSYLKRIAYKLTDYTGDLINPFNEKERFNDIEYANYLNNTFETPKEVVSGILEAYEINCSNIHNLQAEEFDKLIEKYKAGTDFDILSALSQNTILKDAIDLNISKANEEYLLKGFEYADRHGINEALFKVRILKNLFVRNAEEIYGYFMGVILCDEIKQVLAYSPKRVFIGGKKVIKDCEALLLRKISKAETVVKSDDAENASALGVVKVYEYRNETVSQDSLQTGGG